MKPAKFDYYRAENIQHACTLLKEYGDDAKILAGGQSLIAAMNYRLARPEVLIDISNIDTPNRVIDEENGVRVIATTTQRFAEKDAGLRKRIPVLVDAIEHIAHFQIRNKGTVGGSIVNADPASELPAMSLLLDAEFEIQSASNKKVVPAEDFFITYMTTSLETDEILSSILFKAPPQTSGWGFHEVARRSGDFALAGSAAIIDLDADNKCSFARVTLFGVAATPVRGTEVEKALLGKQCSLELLKEAAVNVRDIIDPESDVHVTDEYRRNVAEVLTVRALEDALRRAGANES
jgi:CO/xanthine dehydrogenase FAD-binding subunit